MTGRCYIPIDYLKSDELKYLTTDRNPFRISNARLKRCAEKMLDVADRLANEATEGINLLPNRCRAVVLLICEIYQDVGRRIRTNSYFERMTTLSKFEKICILIKCLYFTLLNE